MLVFYLQWPWPQSWGLSSRTQTRGITMTLVFGHSHSSRHRERRNSVSDVCTCGKKSDFSRRWEINPHILYTLPLLLHIQEKMVLCLCALPFCWHVSGRGSKRWEFLLGIGVPAAGVHHPLLLPQAAQKPYLAGEDSVVGNLVEKLFTCMRRNINLVPCCTIWRMKLTLSLSL